MTSMTLKTTLPKAILAASAALALTLALGFAAEASAHAKLVKSDKVSGPIVDAFRRIQEKSGDSEAYDYLRVEADGFHCTPYGYCVNSFTVDPCPKHPNPCRRRRRRWNPSRARSS